MLSIERRNDVVVVRLSDIKRRNALSRELVSKLMGIDCDVDVVVITNEGSVFSAGLDLRELLGDRQSVRDYLANIHGLVKALVECNSRVLFVLRGDAYGMGVELTYFGDLVLATSPDLVLSLQGVALGVIPPYTIALGPELLGYNAMRVLLSKPIRAEEAMMLGVVHGIGDVGHVDRVFRAPRHVASRASARRRIAHILDKAEQVLDELAELATTEETRSLIESFLKRRGSA